MKKKVIARQSNQISWSEAPALFAVLMAINVTCYAVCTPLMVKVIEFNMISVLSIVIMLGFVALGSCAYGLLSKRKAKGLGAVSFIGLAALGIVTLVLDAIDVVGIPGPQVMATMTGDSIFFTGTYIISDVFSEVFGYKASRLSGNASAIISATIALIAKLMTFIPAPEYAEVNEAAFDQIYGGGLYVTLMGILIYAVGDFANDKLFNFIRSKKSGTDLGSYSLRAIGSSFLGKTVDLSMFSLLVMVPLSTPAICDKLGIESWGMDASSIMGNYLLGIGQQLTIEMLMAPVAFYIAARIRSSIKSKS